MLYKGFGFPYEGRNLRFVTTILDLDLSWSLGSTLYEANAMPWDLDGPHGETYKYEMGETKTSGEEAGNEKAVRGRKDPHLDQDDDTPVEDGRGKKISKDEQKARKKTAKEEEKWSKKHHGTRRDRAHGRFQHEASDDRHRDSSATSGDRLKRESKEINDESDDAESSKNKNTEADRSVSSHTPTAWQTPSVWGAVGVSARSASLTILLRYKFTDVLSPRLFLSLSWLVPSLWLDRHRCGVVPLHPTNARLIRSDRVLAVPLFRLTIQR